jgi:uncharacterized protein YabN with tetrapyrrole methylase and pyrophosphatase domain
VDDVLDRLAQKLIDRHPHVFGSVKAETAGEVVRNWEALKKQEAESKGALHSHPGSSLLSGISRAMPAMLEATKVSRKAASVGFDWPNVSGIFDKLDEEVSELKENISDLPQPVKPAAGHAGSRNHPITTDLQERLEGEIGDLFFVLVNLARFLDVDPESALRRTTRKFRSRFEYMETRARERAVKLEEMNLEQLEELWQQSKNLETVTR